jgi:hypothetical protein
MADELLLDDVEEAITAEPAPAVEPETLAPTAPAEAPTTGTATSGAQWTAVGDGGYRVRCKCGMKWSVRAAGRHRCHECGLESAIG